MILPNKIQLNKAKAQETKAMIDEGVAMAKRVDAVRELKLVQEANIKEWRNVTVKAVQDEINELLSKRDTLKSEINVAQERRDELRKPLDYEWIKLNDEKSQFKEEKKALDLDRMSFKIEVESFEKEKVKVTKAIEKAESNEKDTEKLKIEAQKLKDLAQKEYALAVNEREDQTRIYDRKVSEVNQSATEYAVALQTIEVREKQVNDKELELITRERDLARRITNLQRAEGTK